MKDAFVKLRLSQEDKNRLQAMAKEQKTTVSNLIRTAVL